MTPLIAVMLLAGAVSLALVAAGRRQLAVLPLVGELAMLLAMLDTHWPGLGVVPALAWAAALTVCALGTALVDRLRREASVELHGDRLHTVGMLLAAGLLALGASPAPGGAAHGHGGLGLALPLLLALGAYAVVAAAALRRGTGRERLRRAASTVALLAMGGMALG